MGIKGLKGYIKKTIPNGEGLSRVSLSKYYDKTIGLDFTNFLYKFLLISDMQDYYLLEFVNIIHKFSKYGIKILFIFDGKPVDEKQKTIDRRKTIRKIARDKYEELCKDGDGDGDGNGDGDGTKTKETIVDRKKQLLKLRKKSVSITFEHIQNCKKLFNLMNIEWYHVKNIEADLIFKYCFDIGKIDACYSADTDMLLYECPILLQDLDFCNDDIYEYNYNKILSYLNLSNFQLLNACIASGTDFNYPLKNCKIEDNIKLIQKYNTIENIIDNLETINLNNLCKIEVPVDFNYKLVTRLYISPISEDAKTDINNQILVYNQLKYKSYIN